MKKITLFFIVNIILMFTLTACSVRKEDKKNYSNSIVNSECEVDLQSEFNSKLKSTEKADIDTPERSLYDKAKEKYLSGEWDGTPIEIDSHTVSLSNGGGYILVDGYISESQECLDLLECDINIQQINSSNYCYIPGQGTYFIYNGSLVKSLRGEIIILQGEHLKFRDNKELESTHLRYNTTLNKLFLETGDIVCEGPSRIYSFPDYNISQIEYVGEYNGSFCNGMGQTELFYTDDKGYCHTIIFEY